MKSQEYVQQELNSRACLQSMLSLSTDDCMRRQQKFKSRIQPHECLRHQAWLEILAIGVGAGHCDWKINIKKRKVYFL